ncbi:MAG: hypothetical protein ACYDC0_16745 [Acidimicrobiales bacterium]
MSSGPALSVCTLATLAETTRVPSRTLARWREWEDFPPPVGTIAGVKVYDRASAEAWIWARRLRGPRSAASIGAMAQINFRLGSHQALAVRAMAQEHDETVGQLLIDLLAEHVENCPRCAKAADDA